MQGKSQGNLVQLNLSLVDMELLVAEVAGKVWNIRPKNDDPAAKLLLSDENCGSL